MCAHLDAVGGWRLPVGGVLGPLLYQPGGALPRALQYICIKDSSRLHFNIGKLHLPAASANLQSHEHMHMTAVAQPTVFIYACCHGDFYFFSLKKWYLTWSALCARACTHTNFMHLQLCIWSHLQEQLHCIKVMGSAGEPLCECLCTGSKFCWALRQQHPFIHAWACMEIYARACIELPAWGTCLSAFFPVCALVSNCHHALQCVLSCASLYKYAVFMFSSSAHLIALTSWSLLGCFLFMPVYILAHYNSNAYFFNVWGHSASLGLSGITSGPYFGTKVWLFIPQSLPLEQLRCLQAGIPTVGVLWAARWARLSVVNKVGQILFTRSQ